MGGGWTPLSLEENNIRNEYLVDTETNEVIYPYTTATNIIGLKEATAPSEPDDSKEDNTNKPWQFNPEIDIIRWQAVLNNNEASGTSTSNSTPFYYYTKVTITENMVGLHELYLNHIVKSLHLSNLDVNAAFSQDIVGCKLWFNIEGPK